MPSISGAIKVLTWETAFSTPFPKKREGSPSLSSRASRLPVEAPEGTGDTGGPIASGVSISGIYPNPNAGTCWTVEFQAPEGVQPVISVFDLSGRLILSSPGDPTVNGVNTATIFPEGMGLASGCYLVQVAAEGSRDTSRLVVIR